MTAWSPVPGWESWFNEGAGVAVADISGNGQPDLLVFRVDAVPDGQNAGYYRIGWDIDAAGQVTGWSPWLAVPDWFLWFNAGADVTVADIDGDGVLDLVVLMVDSPAGRNQGYYRSGPLNPDGTVAAWRPWVAVPDWYFWENQGPESRSRTWTAMGRRSSLPSQWTIRPGRTAAITRWAGTSRMAVRSRVGGRGRKYRDEQADMRAVKISGLDGLLVSRMMSQKSETDWSVLIRGLTGEDDFTAKNEVAAAVLVIPSGDRAFAICYGMGHLRSMRSRRTSSALESTRQRICMAWR